MKRILILMFAASLAAGNLWAASEDARSSNASMIMPFPETLPMAEQEVISRESLFKESIAYQQYSRRPKTEFSKLIYLIERIKNQNCKIQYNGQLYEASRIIGLVKAHIALNFRNEKAKVWINTHGYRSSKGRVIYLKYSDGKNRLLRDVLLEELALISDPS